VGVSCLFYTGYVYMCMCVCCVNVLNVWTCVHVNGCMRWKKKPTMYPYRDMLPHLGLELLFHTLLSLMRFDLPSCRCGCDCRDCRLTFDTAALFVLWLLFCFRLPASHNTFCTA
jgi:hypothetical protein